jgi:hypothetical protein
MQSLAVKPFKVLKWLVVANIKDELKLLVFLFSALAQSSGYLVVETKFIIVLH